MKLNSLLLSYIICLAFTQPSSGQVAHNFLFTKGSGNISTITTTTIRSTQCSIIEYPDFLVVSEVTPISGEKNRSKNEPNPLITFIDSIYSNKPIKYVLNSHHHSHSLSTITSFLDIGAKLITSTKNIALYNKRGLFGDGKSNQYSESIIEISSDTTLLSDTKNPIEVFYLKKSEYSSIPTETFLFFYFPKQKLLATSCMVSLSDTNAIYGYSGLLYTGRLVDTKKIISDKKIDVENTLQLFRIRVKDNMRKPPIFSMSYFQDVLEYGWRRKDLAEHIQNMSYQELTTKQDSLLSFLGENNIYYNILNRIVYSLIDKKEYKKAVAVAQLLVIYEPGNPNEIDTLGEAYFNNGQLVMAQHYDRLLHRTSTNMEGLGLKAWKTSQKNRLASSN